MQINGIRYLTHGEVEASAKFGNRIAAKIAKGKPINANSALRHALMFEGPKHAALLAMRLMNISNADARKYVDNLARTKNVDIVSPHCK